MEITASTDPHDIPLIVDGNYARAKIGSTKQKDVEDMRAFLTDSGAVGVVILAQKDLGASPRDNTVEAIKSGETLEASVTSYIKAQSALTHIANAADLTKLCLDILGEARQTEEA